MSHFTQRAFVPERMDDPDVPREELAQALRFIRSVNRWLGGSAAALAWLDDWTRSSGKSSGNSNSSGSARGTALRRAPSGRLLLRVIDLGTGSADIPVAMVRWGERRGIDVEVVAVDNHSTVVELAREWLATQGLDASGHGSRAPSDANRRATDDGAGRSRAPIELLEADARTLIDRFEPGSFDIAHAGMFLHHLPDIEAITVLRVMQRLARIGVIWNDLTRSAVAKLAVRALVLGSSATVRHDAIVSVAKGFTRGEALDLAARAGLERVRFRQHLCGRFTLVQAP